MAKLLRGVPVGEWVNALCFSYGAPAFRDALTGKADPKLNAKVGALVDFFGRTAVEAALEGA